MGGWDNWSGASVDGRAVKPDADLGWPDNLPPYGRLRLEYRTRHTAGGGGAVVE